MQLADWILAASVVVTDAAGHHPTKPIARAGAEAIALACENIASGNVADGKLCASVYVVQAFRESGYQLAAVSRTDCRDHVTGKVYTVPYGQPCRPGDEHVNAGPFQTGGRPPKTWAEAVARFTPLLVRSAHTCKEPLELLATGRCGTAVGAAISQARMAEARRLVAETPEE